MTTPPTATERQFVARFGPELYYLFAGARQQLLSSIQQRAGLSAEQAIINQVYKYWGWKNDAALSIAGLCQQLNNKYSTAEIAEAGRHLRAEKIINFSGDFSSGNATLVSALCPSPERQAGEDFLCLAHWAAAAEDKRAALAYYGPEGVLRHWGRAWQAATLARERCQNLTQEALVQRLMFRALSRWSGSVDVEQLLLGQGVRDEKRRELISELQALVDCQAISAVRRPSASGIVTLYRLDLEQQETRYTDIQKLSPGQLDALAAEQISLSSYFITAGRLYQAQRLAQRQASNKLQQRLIATIAKYQLANPNSGLRLPGLGIEDLIARPELQTYSPKMVQAGAEQLANRGVLRAVYRHRQICYCLPLPVFNQRYWQQRQPPEDQAAKAIAKYGLQNYYFQSARMLQTFAADSDQQSALVERIKSILATRALLSESQRWFSQQEIARQLPNIYADQRHLDSIFQQLRESGLIEQRQKSSENYYAAIRPQ